VKDHLLFLLFTKTAAPGHFPPPTPRGPDYNSAFFKPFLDVKMTP